MALTFSVTVGSGHVQGQAPSQKRHGQGKNPCTERHSEGDSPRYGAPS